ncbi:titin-like [Pseudochaenichthys georgianus]|uniref:titin-like n=1 Tax=Pseudochaenichthys georgianus TaxID=52239 RepID=UPI00146AF399|nr:titin-like [Pseudochaenichthys georgianus]
MFDPPDAPSTPRVHEVTASSAKISWHEPKDNGSPILGYWIERKEVNSKHWTRVNRALLNSLDVRVEGLMEGLTYIFRVCAENLAGPGPFSEPSERTVAMDAIMTPGPPTPWIADTGKDSVIVAWKPPLYNGGGDILGYHLEKVLVGEKEWSRCTEFRCKDLTFTVTGLTEGADYYIRVIAINDAGPGVPGVTEPVTVKEPEETPAVSLDASVRSGVILRAGAALRLPALVSGRPQPEVKWSKDEKDPEAERMLVETQGRNTTLCIKKAVRADTGLFRVSGTNSSGTKSAECRVSVMDVPGPVVDLKTVQVTKKNITLTWSDPLDNGGSDILGYEVLRKDAKMKLFRQPMETASCKCDITGLLAGEEYDFRVIARNKFGDGTPADLGPILAVDPKGLPTAPEKLHYTDRGKSYISLAWEAPRSDGGSPILGYVLEKMRSDASEFEPASRKMFPECCGTLENLSENMEYEFRVHAVTEVGDGDNCKPISVRIQDDEIAPAITILKFFKNNCISVKKGSSIDVPAEVRGLPLPTLRWTKDGEELLPLEDKLSLESEEVTRTTLRTKISLPGTTRQDTGSYKLRAENCWGSAEHSVRVEILDRPLPPRNIVLSDIKAESCYLTWDAPEDNGGSEITNYILERRDASKKKSDFELVTVHLIERRHGVHKLNVNGQYQFRLKAENRYGVSDGCDSEKVELRDPFGLPGPPRNPSILRATATTMTVTWEPPLDNGGSSIQGYWLEKRERGAVYWARVNRGPVTKPSVKGLQHTVMKLIEGSVYQFRIAACNAAGVGPHCEPTECQLAMEPCNPPSPPGSLEVKDKTKSSVTLSWIPPDRDGGSPVKGYIIEVHEEGSPDWRRVNPADKLHPLTEITVPDLKEGKKCRFRIYAVNAAGNSDPAKTGDVLVQDILIEPTMTLNVNAHELLTCRAGTPLQIPVSFSGRPTPKLTWTFDGPAECEKKNDLHTLPIDSEIQMTDTSSVVLIPESKLTHSGRFIINAENAAGHKLLKVRVTVLDLPGAPRDLKVSDVTRGTCRFTWKAPESDGGERVKSYFIEKKAVNGKAWTKVNPACAAQSLVIPDLINGQEYIFRIRAENRFGFGPLAETELPTKATDPIHPPDPPTRLKIRSVRRGAVSLTWRAPRNDGGAPVTHYSVDLLCWEASGAAKDSWRRCNRRDVDTTSYRVEDLTEGDEYEFRVMAHNEAGQSRPSSTVGPIVLQDQTCAPSIDLKEFMEAEQRSDISIVATVRGCPFPTLTWSKAPAHHPEQRAEVSYDEHINKVVSDDSCTLLVQQANRADTGLYTLTASNSVGRASAEMRLNVLDEAQRAG